MITGLNKGKVSPSDVFNIGKDPQYNTKWTTQTNQYIQSGHSGSLPWNAVPRPPPVYSKNVFTRSPDSHYALVMGEEPRVPVNKQVLLDDIEAESKTQEKMGVMKKSKVLQLDQVLKTIFINNNNFQELQQQATLYETGLIYSLKQSVYDYYKHLLESFVKDNTKDQFDSFALDEELINAYNDKYMHLITRINPQLLEQLREQLQAHLTQYHEQMEVYEIASERESKLVYETPREDDEYAARASERAAEQRVATEKAAKEQAIEERNKAKEMITEYREQSRQKNIHDYERKSSLEANLPPPPPVDDVLPPKLSTKRPADGQQNIYEESVKRPLYKGGICSNPRLQGDIEYILDKALKMAIALQKNELNHDFNGKIAFLKQLREKFGILHHGTDFRSDGSPEDADDADLLRKIFADPNPDEWNATSLIFRHMIEKCPDELANWTMFKYEKVSLREADGKFVYLNHKKQPTEDIVDDTLVPFIFGLEGDNDDDDECPVAAGAVSSSSSGPSKASPNITFYIAITSDYAKLDAYYRPSDLLYGCVDAPIKYRLLCPLFMQPNSAVKYNSTMGTIDINIYNKNPEVTKFVNLALLMDPSVTPPIYTSDFNLRQSVFNGSFTLDPTIQLHYFALAQLLLNPNARISQYFTNLTIRLFNKTFFDLFKSASQIKTPTGGDPIPDLISEIDRFVNNPALTTEAEIYSFISQNNTVYDADRHTLLLTVDETDLAGWIIDYFEDATVSSKPSNAMVGKYSFARFQVLVPSEGGRQEEVRTIYINLQDDFKLSTIEGCVNTIMSAPDYTSLKQTPPNPNTRLISFAEAIYDGMVPADRGANKKEMIALIINTFKSRGDGNQVALLAVLNGAIDELIATNSGIVDPRVIQVFLALQKIISTVITNDKNTVVQCAHQEVAVIKAAGGCQLACTSEEYNDLDCATQKIISFYFSNLLEEIIKKGTAPPVAPPKLKVDTNRVLFVSLPKGNPRKLILASIISIFESFLTYYTRVVDSKNGTPYYRDALLRKGEIEGFFGLLKLKIEELKEMPVDQESVIREFSTCFDDCIRTMSNDAVDFTDTFFYFTRQFQSQFTAEDTFDETLKKYYKLLLKAKNIFDILSGSTVSVLEELESILVKDIVLLTAVLPKDINIPLDLQVQGGIQRKSLSERNLARIQENIKKHIYGEKMRVVFDAFETAIGKEDGSDSVFHLLPSSMSVIKSLIEKQFYAEKKLLSLTDCIKEVEEQRSHVRRSGRQRTNVVYKDVSVKDKNISEKEVKITELEQEKTDLQKKIDDRTLKKKPTKLLQTQFATKEKDIAQLIMEIAEIERDKAAAVLDPFQMLSKMVNPLTVTVQEQFASITTQFSTFRESLPNLSSIVGRATSLFPPLLGGGGGNRRRVYYKKRTTRKKRVQHKTKKTIQKLHKKTKLIKKNKKYTHKKE